MKVQIYALINPLNDTIFYIGATTIPVKKRLSYHCSKMFYRQRLSPIVQRRIDLIKSIKKLKEMPAISVIAEIDKSFVDHCEKFYYSFFKNIGYDLLQDNKKFCYAKQQTNDSILERTLIKNGGRRL